MIPLSHRKVLTSLHKHHPRFESLAGKGTRKITKLIVVLSYDNIKITKYITNVMVVEIGNMKRNNKHLKPLCSVDCK